MTMEAENQEGHIDEPSPPKAWVGQLVAAVEDVARKLGCRAEEIAPEICTRLEVLLAEGSVAFGPRKALSETLRKRAEAVEEILRSTSRLDRRQEELVRRFEEVRAILSSTLVLLRYRCGKTVESLPTKEPRELERTLGLFRADGVTRRPKAKAKPRGRKFLADAFGDSPADKEAPHPKEPGIGN